MHFGSSMIKFVRIKKCNLESKHSIFLIKIEFQGLEPSQSSLIKFNRTYFPKQRKIKRKEKL